MHAKVISFINKKGGVAKTTNAHIIGRELAKDSKVLMIDCDEQASLTSLYDLESFYEKDAISKHLETDSTLQIFSGIKVTPLDITDLAKENIYFPLKELHLVPAPESVNSGLNDAVDGNSSNLMKLKSYIKGIRSEYDYIIIDSLPSFNGLFNSILHASDILVMPVQTLSLSLDAANKFIINLNSVAEDFEKKFDKIFILPTMHEQQLIDSKESYGELCTTFVQAIRSFEHLGQFEVEVLPPIPKRAVFSKAQSYRIFVQDYIEMYEKKQRGNLAIFEKIADKIRKA
jgi:chromosome partitioning protein